MKEDYNLLKESLGNVIKEIDDISESGQMVVDGRQYKVEFSLGGDYKVCQLKHEGYYEQKFFFSSF